jgi:hypothetical protein
MLRNNNKRPANLLIDVILLIVLLLSYEHHATGIILHEWFGIAIATILIVHILFHWKWISCMIMNFFRENAKGQRLKFALNILIFTGFTTIIFSGLMISKSILPSLGIERTQSHFWRWLHFLSVDIMIWLIAIHIALSWSWIIRTFKTLFEHIRITLSPSLTPAPTLTLTPTPTPTPILPGIQGALDVIRKIVLVVIAATIISLTWYGLSATSFAKTRDSLHAREHFRDHRGMGRGPAKGR